MLMHLDYSVLILAKEYPSQKIEEIKLHFLVYLSILASPSSLYIIVIISNRSIFNMCIYSTV